MYATESSEWIILRHLWGSMTKKLVRWEHTVSFAEGNVVSWNCCQVVLDLITSVNDLCKQACLDVPVYVCIRNVCKIHRKHRKQ